jgi:hypothetical protein
VSAARRFVDGWELGASWGFPVAAWISATTSLWGLVGYRFVFLSMLRVINLTLCRVSRSRCEQSLLIPDFELLLIQEQGKVGDHLVLVLGFGLHKVCQLLLQFGDGVFGGPVAVR